MIRNFFTSFKNSYGISLAKREKFLGRAKKEGVVDKRAFERSEKPAIDKMEKVWYNIYRK